jgi:type IV secretory pathway protease TraF
MSKSWKVLITLWALLIGGYILSRFYQLKWNPSPSMPEKLWLVKVGERNVKNEDYIVFKFHDYRMEDPFDYELVVKQIAGSAGDKIITREWNGNAEGVAKPNKTSWIYILPTGTYPTFDVLSHYHFTPLTTTDLVIPKEYYFVHGNAHPSFDSRYKEFGLVSEAQIYGKAYPLW